MDRRVVCAARRWIGTPYLHQASQRAVGADCLGLIRGIWCELYGAEPETPPPYTPDWGETGGDEPLMRAALRHFRAVKKGEPMRSGEVLLFRMRTGAVAKHLGVLSGQQRFIHAYPKHGVVESPLTTPWAQRIAGRFRFP